MDVGRLEGRSRCFRFTADRATPSQARDALEASFGAIDPGAKLAAGLLARTLTAICIRDDGGEVRLELTVEADVIRVAVGGEEPGFRLPPSPGSIDEFSFGDDAAPPIGWRSYLLDRLADDWGIDAEAGVAWFEVDHASGAARRLQSRRRALSV